MSIVADASVLIGLSSIGQLASLRKRFSGGRGLSLALAGHRDGVWACRPCIIIDRAGPAGQRRVLLSPPGKDACGRSIISIANGEW
jgi:hypothetical protein